MSDKVWAFPDELLERMTAEGFDALAEVAPNLARYTLALKGALWEARSCLNRDDIYPECVERINALLPDEASSPEGGGGSQDAGEEVRDGE